MRGTVISLEARAQTGTLVLLLGNARWKVRAHRDEWLEWQHGIAMLFWEYERTPPVGFDL